MQFELQILPPWAMKRIQFFLLRSPSTWRTCSWASKENLQAAKEILIECCLEEFRMNKYSVAATKKVKKFADALLRVARQGDGIAVGCFLQCLQCPSEHALTYIKALSKIASKGDERVVNILLNILDHSTTYAWENCFSDRLRARAFKLLLQFVCDWNTNAISFMKQVLCDLGQIYQPKEILVCLEGLVALRQIEDTKFLSQMQSLAKVPGAIYPLLVLSHAIDYYDTELLNRLLYGLCVPQNDELLHEGFRALVRLVGIDKRKIVRFLLYNLNHAELMKLSVDALLTLGEKGSAVTVAACLDAMQMFLAQDVEASRVWAYLLPQLINTGDAKAINLLLKAIPRCRRKSVWIALFSLLDPYDQSLLPIMRQASARPFYWKQVLRAVGEATRSGIVQGIRLDLSIDCDTSDDDSDTAGSEATIEYGEINDEEFWTLIEPTRD